MKPEGRTPISVSPVRISDKGTGNLLPVAIMAHNEEKDINKSIESVLEQKVPKKYSVKVVVVANGCSDKTEEIVKGLVEQDPDRIVLLSMQDKGKSKAINRAIAYFDELAKKDYFIPCIIFLDADCKFLGDDVLINFFNRFEQNHHLCAVGANYLPDVFFNNRTDIVGDTYRTIYKLRELLNINSISGMCYCIKYHILKDIKFPNIQFNEDMYVSSRLDGWFFQDKNIKVVFKTPCSLKDELKRRTRQEVSTQRYHEYYSSLKKKGIMVKLYEKSFSEEYRWRGATGNHVTQIWFSMKGFRAKLLIIVYGLTRLWAKINAYFILKKLKKNRDLDFWEVIR